MFDYVAAAVLAADVDAAVLVATMTPPYVRQKRLLVGLRLCDRLLHVPPRCGCRANTQQKQQQHPAVSTAVLE